LASVQSSYPRPKAPGASIPRVGPGVAKVPDALRGEKHYAAKMKQKDVDELRADRERGMTVDELFLKCHARCGISHRNIRAILSGQSWK
jgi:hypothetical protein